MRHLPGRFAPSKNIHHPSATLRAGSDTEDTEFWFLLSFLRDLGASVVNFLPYGRAVAMQHSACRKIGAAGLGEATMVRNRSPVSCHQPWKICPPS